MKFLGIMLQERRKAKGWTQEELANRINIGRSYLSQVEGLKIIPNEQLVQRLAQELGDDPKPYLQARQTQKVITTNPLERSKIEVENLE